jgi:glycerate kinase
MSKGQECDGPVRAVNLLHVLRAVACPDKFRGTLSAPEATAAIARGLGRAGFDDVVHVPLADGGEGTLDALLAARGGSRERARARRAAQRSVARDDTWHG